MTVDPLVIRRERLTDLWVLPEAVTNFQYAVAKEITADGDIFGFERSFLFAKIVEVLFASGEVLLVDLAAFLPAVDPMLEVTNTTR